jgi:tetratricopeptide (TPR) repeat protein
MMKYTPILFSLLLAACAHPPQRAAAESAQPASQEAQADQDVDTLDADTQDAGDTGDDTQLAPHDVKQQAALPHLELDRQMVYDFLLGDIANQRGKPELAAQIYLDLAKSTRDPRVARRAASLAMNARQMDKAIEAFNLWLEFDPNALQAKEMLSTLLLANGKLEEARPYLISLMTQYPGMAGHTFMQIYPLVARNPDKEAVYSLLHDLAQSYPRVPEAHWALAQAAEASGKHKQALDESRRAHDLRPEWSSAVLLEAQLMLRDSPKQTLALLKEYLASYPDAGEVRLFYARALMDQEKFTEARAEFRQLLDKYPNNADLVFAVALLSLQMGDLDQAEQELREALTKGKKDENVVYYYLGQLDEAKKDDGAALQNYRKVEGGEYAYAAQLRVAYLLNKDGKREEAIQSLHQIKAQNNEQRVQLVLIESQLLSDAQQFEEAYQVLLRELDKLPDHPELLYQAAMMADKLGKPADFERMMRKAIKVKPDYAQAYNALGYSLLDRNERVPEAMELVEKAYQLAPNDAGIIDSVGWGHYRLGNLPKSLEFLRRAYAADPDPEIAAHLGEVLWMQGDKTQAKKIWGDALKSHPENTVLQSAVKRFDP